MSHVIFRKQVSDGNYGTESAEVLLEVSETTTYGELDPMAIAMEHARFLVHAELARSPAWRVRDAVTPSDVPTTAVTVPADDEDLPY